MGNSEITEAVLVTRLQTWLSDIFQGASDLRITNMQRPSAGGFSAETLLFDLSFQRDRQQHQQGLVLRRQVVGHEILHQSGLGLESQVMGFLYDSPHFPVAVPKVLGYEADPAILGNAFLVVEQLPGRIVPQNPNYNLSGWVQALSEAQRHELWANGIQAMAEVHKLDAAPLLPLLSRGKTPNLAGLVSWIEDWLTWALQGRAHPVARKALAYLKRECPCDTANGLIWGDSIPANMLFGDDLKVTGLIDWELAMAGPGEVDLAWWLLFDELFSSGYGIPRLPGLPDKAQTLSRYENAIGRTVSNIHYYEVLAWLRMSIVTIRAVDRLVAQHRFKASNDAWLNNPSSLGLAQRLDDTSVSIGADFLEFSKVLMAPH